MILRTLLFSIFLAFAQAIEITGVIQPNAHLPSAALLPVSTLLTLSAPGVEYAVHPSSSGKFTFYNVTAGPSYLLKVDCLTHAFQPLRIDTRFEEIEVYQTFKDNEWEHRGAKFVYPIEISPSTKAEYYVVLPLVLLTNEASIGI